MLNLAMTSTLNNNEFRSGTSDALTGSLLGCALGDSVGLPFEGISARRIRRLNPGPLGHAFGGLPQVVGGLGVLLHLR